MKILGSIIRKEFIHIRNDLQTLIVVFLFPILMLFLFGYAITFELRNIPTVINDLDNTSCSREFIGKLAAGNFFQIHQAALSDQEIVEEFQKNTARCVIVIPKNFTADRYKPSGVQLQVLIDASDPNAATLIQNYLNSIIQKQFPGSIPLTRVESRFFYNPDQKSVIFFVPGLIAIIVLLISALLTSIAITKEKETGTFEQMLVSPVKPEQIILGKLIPYSVIAFLSSLFILITGILFFKVPCAGHWWLLLLMLFLYILVGLCLGLLISTTVKNQQEALLLTLVITILPTIMLSGFIFPIDSMPIIFRYVATIFVPARHFTIIIRGIMLKGNVFKDLLQPFFSLFTMALVLLMVSIKKFKARLG